MKTIVRIRRLLSITFVLTAACLGCDGKPAPAPEPASEPASKLDESSEFYHHRIQIGGLLASSPAGPLQVLPNVQLYRKVQLGKGVWLEIQPARRRVLVESTVCLREGSYGLECLLCRKNTKEHESILATDAEARLIHTGLLVTGVKPGSPTTFHPKFKTATGDRIKITLQYEDKGKLMTVPAQTWIVNKKTNKELDADWVFGGSLFYKNPLDESKPLVYAADSDGAYIAVSNVPSAMLDLPIDDPKGLEERVFELYTKRIPPLDAKVTLILEPLPSAKK